MDIKVDVNMAGKGTKYLKEVIIPEYRRQKQKYEDRLDWFLRFVQFRENQILEKNKEIKKLRTQIRLQEKKLKISIEIAKQGGGDLGDDFYRTKRKRKHIRKPRKRKVLRAATRKKFMQMAQINQYARTYHQDKVWQARLNADPVVAFLTYPIVDLYFTETNLNPTIGKILMLVTQYEWFVPADATDWGLPLLGVRTKLNKLVELGYLTVYEERNRNLYKVSPEGAKWYNGFVAFYNEKAELLSKDKPSEKLNLPLATRMPTRFNTKKQEDGKTEL